jgi:ABC-2 type transport system permease protein
MTADQRSFQPPTLWSSALRIFDLSLGQMLWSRRSVFLGVLLGGPVVLAIVLRTISVLYASSFHINGALAGGPAIFGMMIWLLYIRFIVPVLGVFFGTALIADEVDDKTITYLFTRPIPRSAVLLGKYLAYLVCTGLLILPSVVIVYFLIVPIAGGSIGGAFPSLVFAFGWEPGVLLFPGYLKRATVAYYLQALVTHEMPQDSAVSLLMQVFREVPGVLASLTSLAVIVSVTLWLAARTVEQREYVLDQ